MKLVKGISLFIVFVGIFICGCYLGSAYKQFFYPGDTQKYLNVSHMKKQVITADTEYVVVSVNADGNREEILPVPEQYIGMDLNTYTQTIEKLNESPALSELKRGFQNSVVQNFSRDRVVLYKYYEKPTSQEDIFYYLAVQNGKVVVLHSDEQTLYMSTDISAETLPEDILFDLIQKRVVNTQAMYDFLESYSS
ncbi:MAG: hypothetical protein E7299_02025 [Lachnospiraceae bacterium]|nr:hypothetical protein [Lachnospiraceae bacterium]